jgi:hypothetical protein
VKDLGGSHDHQAATLFMLQACCMELPRAVVNGWNKTETLATRLQHEIGRVEN